MLLSQLMKKADHPYMMGAGGRLRNNNPLKFNPWGLHTLRRHPAITPLTIIFTTAIFMDLCYVAYLMKKSDAINWTKSKQLKEDFYNHRQGKLVDHVIDRPKPYDPRTAPNYED